MTVEREFEEFLQELFEPVGGVSLRRMFGGLGVFRHGLMFGLVADGRLCLKVDDKNRQDYENECSGEWSYDGKGKPVKMGYWYVPERLMDEPEEFAIWAERAFDAAVRIDQAKPPSQRKLKL
ncbi:MAG: TfoX/Sxy family protein [Pseudomonadota bacterium]